MSSPLSSFICLTFFVVRYVSSRYEVDDALSSARCPRSFDTPRRSKITTKTITAVLMLISGIIGFNNAHFNRLPGRAFLERVLKTFIITLMDPKEIRALIEAGMPGSSVDVEGDGTHFEAVIVSSDFNGKTLLERHQQVYKVLGEAMKERIHALSLKTYTPEQWEKIK